jgi:hypothetical protein
MTTEKLSNENETEALNKHVVMQALPLAFVKWYSGMEVKTILKAYERWKKESGIVSVASSAVGSQTMSAEHLWELLRDLEMGKLSAKYVFDKISRG